MSQSKVSRSRKRELEQPDEFLTVGQRFVAACIENKTTTIAIVAFIFVALAGVSMMKFFGVRAETKAGELLTIARTEHAESVVKFGPHKALEENQAKFQEILDNYPRLKNTSITRVFFGHACYHAGEYDQAINLYNTALNAFKKDPYYRDLLTNSLAYAYEGKKDYTNSLRYFKLVEEKADEALKAESVFNQGRIYELMGDTAKSQNFFDRIVKEFPESIYIDVAKEKFPT